MIEFTNHYDFRGNIETTEYRWKGGPVADISIFVADDYKWTDGEATIGPFRVKKIDEYMDRITVVRKDYFLWRLIYLWHRYGIMFDIAYRRFIITLAVWRLADYNRDLIPTWRDIKLFRR